MHVQDSEEAEIEAIRHMILILKVSDFHFKKLIIYSDSSNAINYMLNDIHDQTGLKFSPAATANPFVEGLYLCFVPRDLNNNADFLAKLGIKRDFLVDYWAEENKVEDSTGGPLRSNLGC